MLDFKAASAAYEKGDWSMLIQIAEKYNIFPDDLGGSNTCYERRSKRLRKPYKKQQGNVFLEISRMRK